MTTIRAIVCLLPWVCSLLAASVGTGLLDDSRSARGAEGKGQPTDAVRGFLLNNCLDCHQGDGAEAGFDLDALTTDLADESAERRWIQIIDRVRLGEMPPEDAETPDRADVDTFLESAGDWVRTFQHERDAQLGRVRTRRLTRREVERSLHDLLGIDVPLANQLPEDPSLADFDTVADGQSISHFQLERHLAVVDVALDEAFRRGLSREREYQREFDAEGVARRDPRRRTREPEMRQDQAVVWSSGLAYYGRIPATTAWESGWYRFTVRISGLKLPRHGGVWTTVHTGMCVSSAPLLTYVTAFEATEEPRDITFEAWLPRRHMLEIRPRDATLPRAKFAGGQVGTGEGEPQDVPGIAIDRLTMERVHHGPSDAEIREMLFGDLPVATGPRDDGPRDFGSRYSRSRNSRSRSSRSRSAGSREDSSQPIASQPTTTQPVTNEQKAEIPRLLADFARRAFRRPVSEGGLSGYLELATSALEERDDVLGALRVGYRAILCSPRFLYLTESPGELDDYAIAARLSYFLTGSTPDARLEKLAGQGRLHDPDVLRAETNRLLEGQGGRRFVSDFAAQWLDLDQIDFTQPDRKLYPTFDPIVQRSMLDETVTYLESMLHDDLSVAHLIRSDFTFLNSRLARYYDIDGVEGDELQRVRLSPRNHRGGLLTQGAILKVTANGSNTSPVIRGVWVSERLLGVPIPPPPANVPAIEPDIRGAKTIREQLAKHRSQESCAVCHVKIDPPGFALENFDPAGQWRDKYTQIINGRRARGATIDASYSLPDGREFADVDEFQKLIVAEPRRLAANVAEKLLIYGTGAPISFADRTAVERVVDEASQADYGFRSLVAAVVTSPVFLSK